MLSLWTVFEEASLRPVGLFHLPSKVNFFDIKFKLIKILKKKYGNMRNFLSDSRLKVAFIQNVLMHLSFPQTNKPYYFPELEF